MEKTWDVAVRKMFNVPRDTHCYFIEALSESLHIRTVLRRRFVKFISSIRTGNKNALKKVLRVVQYDARSVTGNNLRKIMISECKPSIYLDPRDITSSYKMVPDENMFRVNMVKEIIDLRQDELVIPGFNAEEIEDILTYLCTA